MKLCATVNTPKNEKLKAEKSSMYFHALSPDLDVYSRKVIREAREEISVPTPPIFTPTSKAFQLLVNCDNKIAEGTLLMIWQESTDTSNGFLRIKPLNSVCTAGMRAIFPEKMKNIKKVKRSP